MAAHPIVVATIRRHLAEAELRVAVLKSKREEIPATRGAMVAASRIHRQIAQAELVAGSWRTIEESLHRNEESK